MNENLENMVKSLVLPLIEAQGLILWGIELIPGPTLKVAIYVDVPQGEPGSATIDQCETISRQLGLALEVEDCITQPWLLEVSSPGLERRFFTLDEMRPYLGDMIDVRCKEPVNGRKAWRGKLLKVDCGEFEILPASISGMGEIREDGVSPVSISWNNTAKVHRIHIFTIPSKPGKTPGPGKKPAK